MESNLSSEDSSIGSSSELADPVVMPPVTTLAIPSANAPVTMLHQLVQETAKETPPPVVVATSTAVPPPPNGCANNSQAGPANGYATLTGNGTVRSPPEGMEDVPLASDIPPV